MAISEFAKQYHEKVFPGSVAAFPETAPEFIERFDNFAFDEVIHQGSLDGKTRFLAILATLLGCQGTDEFRSMLPAVLNMGRVYPFLKITNGAGVSPSQAPIQAILKVDLYGTAVLLEEVGKVIAAGGVGVTVSSRSGWRMPALTAAEDEALATIPTEELQTWDLSQEEPKILKKKRHLSMRDGAFSCGRLTKLTDPPAGLSSPGHSVEPRPGRWRCKEVRSPAGRGGTGERGSEGAYDRCNNPPKYRAPRHSRYCRPAPARRRWLPPGRRYGNKGTGRPQVRGTRRSG